MEAEAQPLIDDLNLRKDEPSLIPAPAPIVTFSGEFKGAKIHVACNGTPPLQEAIFPLNLLPSLYTLCNKNRYVHVLLMPACPRRLCLSVETCKDADSLLKG